MRLVFLIKSYFTLLFTFGLVSNLYAVHDHENDSTKYKIESKYKKEFSPYFSFKTFYRGEDSKVLNNRMDSLTIKEKSFWTRHDSLSFAKTNLLTGNTKLAEHYFSHINIDPKNNYSDNLHDLCAIYVSKNFKKGINKINSNYPKIVQFSEMYFLKVIFSYQDSVKNNSTWYKSSPSVFQFNIDSNKVYNKKEQLFKDQIIEPLINVTTILELIVFYVHEEDLVIARAFNDLGIILENHVSLSQAYIAYSIGRNYNKKDKDILENIKVVKAKLLQKNYKIPNFRKYFPRIEYWRFDYDILKEKIISEKNDTIPKHTPILRPEKIKSKTPFPPGIIIPFGILILFLLILLFVKTRKK
jgi:hypothetical protein